jgi:hypothetical protein
MALGLLKSQLDRATALGSCQITAIVLDGPGEFAGSAHSSFIGCLDLRRVDRINLSFSIVYNREGARGCLLFGTALPTTPKPSKRIDVLEGNRHLLPPIPSTQRGGPHPTTGVYFFLPTCVCFRVRVQPTAGLCKF